MDSDENDSFMNQYLDPSDVIGCDDGDDDEVDGSHQPPRAQTDNEEEGVLDYGMYTRTTDNSSCVYCHETYDSKAALYVHKTCYFLRKGVEVSLNGHKLYSN